MYAYLVKYGSENKVDAIMRNFAFFNLTTSLNLRYGTYPLPQPCL